jgi:hypothetical protein
VGEKVELLIHPTVGESENSEGVFDVIPTGFRVGETGSPVGAFVLGSAVGPISLAGDGA